MEVLVILVLIVIVLVIVQAIRTRMSPSARAAALNQRLASVRFMSGSQFEHFVADIMRALVLKRCDRPNHVNLLSTTHLLGNNPHPYQTGSKTESVAVGLARSTALQRVLNLIEFVKY